MINIPIFKLEFQIYWLITLKPISVKMLKIMIIPVSKQSHQIHKMSREIKTVQIKFFMNKAQTINLRRFILYWSSEWIKGSDYNETDVCIYSL